MERLYQSDNLILRYNKDRDIIMGSWLDCDNAEKLINGIQVYKEYFEKIIPEKVVWNETGLQYTIPVTLQDWILDFLDVPACRHGIDYKVAHILSADIYANLSLMDMYTQGKTTFTPHFFTHEKKAMDWIGQKATEVPVTRTRSEPEWKLEKFVATNKARLTIEMDLDTLPDILSDFRRMLQDRRFYAQCLQRFLQLTAKERFVLALVIRGKTNKEIAAVTNTSCETIKTHRRNLLRKLQCTNIAELMQYHVFL